LVSIGQDPRRAGTIWTLDLGQPAPAVTPRLSAAFRRTGSGSISALGVMTGDDGSAGGISPAEMRTRLEMGRRCYTAWVEGKPAAYGWVSFDEEFVGEMDLRLHLLPGEAYIWDCFTLPAFRGQRLYSALLAYIAGQLQAEACRRIWIGADLENLASQRGIARAGFLHVADLEVERVHALRIVRVQPQPGAPERLVNEAQRVFLGNRHKAWREAMSTTKSI
jgi:ribosomal protein S18 acetylase RimI-like enzyme